MDKLINTFNIFSEELNLLLSGENGKHISLQEFNNIVTKAYEENAWFIPKHIKTALSHIASFTKKEVITEWVNKYKYNIPNVPKKVLVVMAGNIPLVGFHDMLSVWITGHRLVAKLSSKDKVLPKFVVNLLTRINGDFSSKYIFTEDTIKDFDAVIATGSDNSALYFEKYFGKYPNIIRRNKNSIAILDGNETEEDLLRLADDIFLYFGLGCRNIAKLYLPKGYDLQKIISTFSKSVYSSFVEHNKYSNNYDYHKAIYIMNNIPFEDGGFFLLKEDTALSSPVSVIYYEHYSKKDNINTKLFPIIDKIQVILKKENFGTAQFPSVMEYADNTDTIKFLTTI